MSKKNRIRLMTDMPLTTGVQYTADEAQTHYLKNVMRLSCGDEVFLFDGRNGEFQSTIIQISKKNLILEVHQKVFTFEKSPDVWLLFAPLKKENTDIVIQKAVELGVSKIVPVQTQYCTNTNIKKERIKAQIIEAVEQCRRQDMPEICDLQNINQLLENWDQKRKLVYLNETGEGLTFYQAFQDMPEPIAFFIGPEGGFSATELAILKSLPYTLSVTLGRRILRAETAAVSALACWQAFCGDWK